MTSLLLLLVAQPLFSEPIVTPLRGPGRVVAIDGGYLVAGRLDSSRVGILRAPAALDDLSLDREFPSPGTLRDLFQENSLPVAVIRTPTAIILNGAISNVFLTLADGGVASAGGTIGVFAPAGPLVFFEATATPMLSPQLFVRPLGQMTARIGFGTGPVACTNGVETILAWENLPPTPTTPAVASGSVWRWPSGMPTSLGGRPVACTTARGEILVARHVQDLLLGLSEWSLLNTSTGSSITLDPEVIDVDYDGVVVWVTTGSGTGASVQRWFLDGGTLDAVPTLVVAESLTDPMVAVTERSRGVLSWTSADGGLRLVLLGARAVGDTCSFDQDCALGRCVSGTCAPRTPPCTLGCGGSELCCIDRCVDPLTNAANCGACGQQCPATRPVCVAGACQPLDAGAVGGGSAGGGSVGGGSVGGGSVGGGSVGGGSAGGGSAGGGSAGGSPGGGGSAGGTGGSAGGSVAGGDAGGSGGGLVAGGGDVGGGGFVAGGTAGGAAGAESGPGGGSPRDDPRSPGTYAVGCGCTSSSLSQLFGLALGVFVLRRKPRRR